MVVSQAADYQAANYQVVDWRMRAWRVGDFQGLDIMSGSGFGLEKSRGTDMCSCTIA
jgi:hypothetical protein